VLSSNLVLAVVALLSLSTSPPAQARALEGEILAAVELPTLAGGKAALVSRTAVNVILFWRPGQEHSLDTLQPMSSCENVFGKAPVHMVAVVSGEYARPEVQAAVDKAALRIPVLIDLGDELYGKLEIRQHPLVLVADAQGKIALAQPYLRLRYCEIVNAHVRFLLKEIDAAQLQAVLEPGRVSMPSDDKRKVARRFVKMGQMEAESGQCEAAVASFKKALEVVPDDADARAGLAECARRLATAKK
jgi:hypothetical protein